MKQNVAMLPGKPSIHPSVTLVYTNHSFKVFFTVITRKQSLVFAKGWEISINLLQGDHSTIPGGTRGR